MTKSPKQPAQLANTLHPRNPHRGRYDLSQLSKTCPELTAYLTSSPRGETTIDFGNDKAVLWLNKALLAQYYNVVHWQIPEGYLCPPIPGRADYIHYLADLIPEATGSADINTRNITALDIGTGANCIYPIIGSQSYGWSFVASDIDPVSVKTASLIVDANKNLKNRISIRQQQNPNAIFEGIIRPGEHFDLTLCNPPFHASQAEAQAANQRKVNNLAKNRPSKHSSVAKQQPSRNFGGQASELWCPGGEIDFLGRMIRESCSFSQQVYCFSSLVSKSENIKLLKKLLSQLGAKQVKVVEMRQGQKISRLLAWSFLTEQQRLNWQHR